MKMEGRMAGGDGDEGGTDKNCSDENSQHPV